MSVVRTLTLALAATLVVASATDARDVRVGALTVRDASVTPTRGGSKTTSGYLSVVSTSKKSDRLMAVSCTCAANVELHRMWMDGTIMRMRRVDGGLEVPTGRVLIFANGGNHLMLLGLKTPLKAGAVVRLTLTFQHAGKVTLDAPVREAPRMTMPNVG
jgi:copper(I)-binding protein